MGGAILTNLASWSRPGTGPATRPPGAGSTPAPLGGPESQSHACRCDLLPSRRCWIVTSGRPFRRALRRPVRRGAGDAGDELLGVLRLLRIHFDFLGLPCDLGLLFGVLPGHQALERTRPLGRWPSRPEPRPPHAGSVGLLRVASLLERSRTDSVECIWPSASIADWRTSSEPSSWIADVSSSSVCGSEKRARPSTAVARTASGAVLCSTRVK